MRLLSMTFIAASCSIFLQSNVSADTREQAVATYAEIVYANYRDAHADALRLKQAVEALVQNPSEEALAAAKEAWLAARESYGQTEVFRFYGGPIDGVGPEAGWAEGVEGPEARLNAWPLNEAFIDYVAGNPDAGIVNDPAVSLTEDALMNRNAVSDEADVTTGYHAIEFLLWGQDLNDDGPGARPASDFVGDAPSVARRRIYLEIVTNLLVSDLKSLTNAWAPTRTDNYRVWFLAQPAGESLGRILTGMATLSGFELASERIVVALDSGDQEDEHSCFSDNTHRDLVANAQAIRNVWLGSYGAVNGTGVAAVVKEADEALAGKIEAINERTVQLAESIEPPVDRILGSPADDPSRRPLAELAEALYDQAELLVRCGAVLGVDAHIAGE